MRLYNTQCMGYGDEDVYISCQDKLSRGSAKHATTRGYVRMRNEVVREFCCKLERVGVEGALRAGVTQATADGFRAKNCPAVLLEKDDKYGYGKVVWSISMPR